MDDIVEKVEIPPYNKDCDHCLANVLNIQAVKKTAQTLAGTDHVIKGSLETIAGKMRNLDKRIEELETFRREAIHATSLSTR